MDGLRQGSGGGPVDKECYALAIDTCARRNQYMHAERLLHDMQVQSPNHYQAPMTLYQTLSH